jgi:NADPH:quinone reductase-like Zn-dependent oxidoreductase
MKAILFTRYGSADVLELKEVEKPLPKDNQVLVRVHAASINALDGHTMKSSPLFIRVVSGNGLFKPKDQRLGVDLAGTVEAVGSNVTQFQPGDEVFGRGVGAFAEFACAREDALVLKPASTSFEAAAAVPVAALTALAALRDHGQIQSGQQVLIQGASGGVGTFAVQLAKVFGAEVTAVCSTRNLEMARSLGADHVIDYAKADVTRQKQRYDLILAVNGYHSIFAYRRILSPTGRCVLVGASASHLLSSLLQAMVLGRAMSRNGKQHFKFFVANPHQADLAWLAEQLEAGTVVPAIDRCYPLSETAEAMRSFERHAQGKIVVTA